MSSHPSPAVRPSRIRRPPALRRLNRLATCLAALAHEIGHIFEQLVAGGLPLFRLEAGASGPWAEPGAGEPALRAGTDLIDLYTQSLCCALAAAVLAPSADLSAIVAFLPGALRASLEEALAAPLLAQRLARWRSLLTEIMGVTADVERGLWMNLLHQDPLIYCYEQFLQAYRPGLRAARGIYATPTPVVAYMVRSIDRLLEEAFGLKGGLLTTERYELLDPAVGCGTFLRGIIDQFYTRLAARSDRPDRPDGWTTAVEALLLPRLRGYELLPAPWALAHLVLGLHLAGHGYDLRQRPGQLRLYLGDALPELAQESPQEALPVILGNPPYGSYGRTPQPAWLRALLQDYKRDLHERKLNLDDDCVKFIRCGQCYIERAGGGLLAFITSHTYLDGLTYRRMREVLLTSFDEIYLLNLHGNSQRASAEDRALHDENVFPIRQGVTIGFFVRHRDQRQNGRRGTAQVHYAELRGPRSEKYARLLTMEIASTPWRRLEPRADLYFFVPRRLDHLAEWQRFPSLAQLFPCFSTGIKTHLDEVLVGESDEIIAHQIARYLAGQSATGDDAEAGKKAQRGSAAHKAHLLRQLAALPPETLYRDYAYRPFDVRRIAYWPAAIEAGDHRFSLMRHVRGDNLLLVSTRQLAQESFSHVFVTATLTDMCLLSTATRESAYVFPLYLCEEEGTSRPNLGAPVLEELAARLKLHFVPQGYGDLRTTFGPEAVVAYCYAVLHAPRYRQRYRELLVSDFPHLPLPPDAGRFRGLVRLGARLLALHLLRAAPRAALATACLAPIEASWPVEEVRYQEGWPEGSAGSVWLNRRQAIIGIPPQLWHFRIGNYQVCARWLQARLGRTLGAADYAHYRRMLAVLAETAALMEMSDAALSYL
jgi:predicted helicase